MTVTSRLGRALTFCALLVTAACGSTTDGGTPATTAGSLAIISGDNQTGFVGLTLATPLAVRVTTTNGVPFPGAVVTFRVVAGSATLTPTSATTDTDGRAQTTLKLGNTAGTIQVTATVEGTGLSATFVEIAGTTNNSIACQAGSATLPALNQVITGLAGTGICLGGSVLSEYTLIAYNGSTVASGSASVDITGRGINMTTAPSLAPVFSKSATGSLLGGPPRNPGTLQAAFDLRLRETARRELTPMMPAARRYAKSRPLRNSIPSAVTVGQVLRLNANSNDACTNAVYRGGRVVAITSKAIIVADTLNPPNGFTDAQYQSIGVTFDTLVDPLDRLNFGDPSDIDNNGKVVIFYTRAVNELTPVKSPEYVGGFFYERDLFPTTATQALQACAGSNVGEMFYMLAPDPTGIINQNIRTTADVKQITIGTVAHEYQHLINAAKRLFITNADFEEVWLNEGLSHIAEELLFYRVSGLAPRQNITSTKIRSTQAIVDAFNEYANANFGRFEEFLQAVPQASPFTADDELKTRGATWALLRYLADHRGSADGDAWSKLVSGPAIGSANLKNVFGTDLTTPARDWATSVYTDDFVTTTDVRFLQPSWNFRSVFTQAFNIVYPLKLTPLGDAVTSTQVIIGGSAAYLRFSVIAGAQGSIDWNATGGAPVSPLVQWTLVRTR